MEEKKTEMQNEEVREEGRKENTKNVETGHADAENHRTDEDYANEEKRKADDQPDSVKEESGKTDADGEDDLLDKCVCRYPREITTAQKVTACLLIGLAAVGTYTIIDRIASCFDGD